MESAEPMPRPSPAEIEARESDQSAIRKETMRRAKFARSFWEECLEQQIGDSNVFGVVEIRIHFRGGEITQVDISPGRTYK